MTLDRRSFIKLGSLAGAAALVLPRGLRAASAGIQPVADPLWEGFVRLPDSARPGVYWWWLDGRVNRRGITRDLEELAAKGIREVLLVNSANFGVPDRAPDSVAFLSPEWRDLYRHALREASRVGIAVGVNLSGGWCMGGPWIPPRHSGRWFLQSRLTLEGPRRFSGALPLPGHRDGYDKVFNPPGFKEYIDLPLEQLDYRDTAVVAVPERAAGETFTGPRAKLLPAKTNRKDASNFVRARDVMGPAEQPLANAPGDHPVPVADVVDLTAKLQPDGHLDWDVPPGRWTIIRTGHRMTGSRLMIPPPEADGLSVDWLATEGVDLQFEHLGKLLLEDAAAAGVPLTYFCDDSFEDGFPNWTEKMVERFREYRGYDPIPYLPVFSGYLIGGAEVSDRFLHDYRKTVADCMADLHYARFAELCHQHGLAVQNEAAGPSRSGTMCMDGLKNLGRSDLPMGEFWLGLRHDEPGGLDPKLGYGVTRLEDGANKVTKMVSSAAHTYGRRKASAEAFTSGRQWLDSPATMKPAADRAFCEGINRFILHESTAVRDEDGKPGHEYYAGTHFNRNQTWWNFVGPFVDYLSRCQFLLQQGRFVADVLYYTGDGAPNVAVPKHVDPSLGFGFDYDVCNAEVLLTRVSVREGRLVLPDGMGYRLLVLPDSEQMPVEVAEKLEQLVRAGATVVGPKPQRDPGLRQYPRCDDAVRSIGNEVWGACDGTAVKTQGYGQGRVFWGVSLREILAADGVAPDFAHSGPDGALDFIHRTTADAEIYFVASKRSIAQTLDCTFRVAGRTPELWDPVSGGRSHPGGPGVPPVMAREGAAWSGTGVPPVTAREGAARSGTGVPPVTARASAARSGTGVSPVTAPAGAAPSGTGVPPVFGTTMQIEFAPHQSWFVVFPRVVSGDQPPSLPPALSLAQTALLALGGNWQVSFDPAWGGPASVEFATLEDWTQRAEPGIKYYSGTATYRKTFRCDRPPGPGRKIFLDLGVVRDIAEVRLNGARAGVVWTAPWRIEIGSWLREGDNTVEIAVANLWPNRLIGDAKCPADQRLTRTNIKIDADAPLLPSGLLGPVVLTEAPQTP